jgi:hypothetical protein
MWLVNVHWVGFFWSFLRVPLSSSNCFSLYWPLQSLNDLALLCNLFFTVCIHIFLLFPFTDSITAFRLVVSQLPIVKARETSVLCFQVLQMLCEKKNNLGVSLCSSLISEGFSKFFFVSWQYFNLENLECMQNKIPLILNFIIIYGFLFSWTTTQKNSFLVLVGY